MKNKRNTVKKLFQIKVQIFFNNNCYEVNFYQKLLSGKIHFYIYT